MSASNDEHESRLVVDDGARYVASLSPEERRKFYEPPMTQEPARRISRRPFTEREIEMMENLTKPPSFKE